jgi:hypothetical protein
MRVTNFLIAAFLAASAIAQQTPPAEPWKWTIEQRIAVRFDPAARAERIAEAQAEDKKHRHPAAMSAGIGEVSPADVISGHAHPELFLPAELFEYFVRDLTWSEQFKIGYQQQADDILRSDEDWRALETRVARYAANLREERQLLDEESRSTRPRRVQIEGRLEEIRGARCALEKEAFRSVRSYFGTARFDRFLYVVTATGHAIGYGGGPGGGWDETKERLMAVERDCQ